MRFCFTLDCNGREELETRRPRRGRLGQARSRVPSDVGVDCHSEVPALRVRQKVRRCMSETERQQLGREEIVVGIGTLWPRADIWSNLGRCCLDQLHRFLHDTSTYDQGHRRGRLCQDIVQAPQTKRRATAKPSRLRRAMPESPRKEASSTPFALLVRA